MHYSPHSFRFILVVLSLLLFCTSGRTQGSTLGKTPEQVVAMDMEKWENFYCEKQGWSTANKADAATVFASSLRKLNDRRSASLPRATRETLGKIRTLAGDFSAGMLEVDARDGGTMWVPLRAGIPAGVEYLASDLIPLLRVRPVSPSTTRKNKIHALIARIEFGLHKAETAVASPEYATVLPRLKKARASFTTIKQRYTQPDWPGSLAVLTWYADHCGEESGITTTSHVTMPPVGSADRKAILDALRVPVARQVKMPVIFLLDKTSLKVQGDWAFLNATTLDKNEKRLNQDYLWGETAALLRRQKGKWKVLVWGFATDTSVMDEAMQKYPNAPRAIYGIEP